MKDLDTMRHLMRKIRLNNFVDLKDKSISSYKLQIQEMGKRNKQRRGI